MTSKNAFIILASCIFSLITISAHTSAQQNSRSFKGKTSDGREMELVVEPGGPSNKKEMSAGFDENMWTFPPTDAHAWIPELLRGPATLKPLRSMVGGLGANRAFYRDERIGLRAMAYNASLWDTWAITLNLTKKIPDTLWSSASATENIDVATLEYFNYHPTADYGRPCFGGFYIRLASWGFPVPVCSYGNSILMTINITSQCSTPGTWNFTMDYNGHSGGQEKRIEQFELYPQVPDEDMYVMGQGLSDTYDHTNQAISKLGCALTCETMVLHNHGERFNLDPASAGYGPAAVRELNTWLIDNNGYTNSSTDAGDIKLDVAHNYYTIYPTTVWVGWGFESGLKDDICRMGPQMLKIPKKTGSGSHFVLAYGRMNTGPNVDTWKIIDPIGSGKDTNLIQFYNDRPQYQQKIASTRLNKGISDGDSQPSATRHLHVRLASPAEFLVTDPAGRRCGIDPASGRKYAEIPNCYYEHSSIEAPDSDVSTAPVAEVYISQTLDGEYEIKITGTGTGTYYFVIRDIGMSGPVPTFETELFDVPTSPGEVHMYSYQFSSNPTSAAALTGGFDGGGQRPADVNRFLTYIKPAQSRTALPAGTKSYTVSVSYGATVDSAKFSAILGGADVTHLFHPVAGTTENVTIPLGPGSKTLTLSIDGINARGTVSTDTDRLTFIVK